MHIISNDNFQKKLMQSARQIASNRRVWVESLWDVRSDGRSLDESALDRINEYKGMPKANHLARARV